MGATERTERRSASIRSRWAAIGAAVAVTLGAGGIGLVQAAPAAGGPVLVSITPCRLMDTRPESAVGPRSAALGAGETYTLAATGANGNCADIPADAVALSLNVTGVDATEPTFLTVFPAGGTRPDASSLNLTPGAAATPNAVVSGLGAGGQLSIFNLQGSAHVLVDVNGYYADHHHDDRYVPLPTTEVVVHPAGMNAFTATSGWTSVLGGTAWAHAASASPECVAAPVELPLGVPVTGLRLVYAASAGVTVQVALFAINRRPGTLLVPTSNATTPVPASPASQTAEIIIPFTTPHEAVDANYSALVCTQQPLGLVSVAVRLV